jgi:hypothetical protein
LDKASLSTEIEGVVRSLGIAIVVAVVLAIGFAVVLNSNQKTAQEEFSTEAARPCSHKSGELRHYSTRLSPVLGS